MLSPIIVFAFCRCTSLQKTIESLKANSESENSDLYIFVDGARPYKVDEKEKVENVRQYVSQITGFKSLHYTFSETNKGLGASIISGVNQVINKYGRAIVLEDDLEVSKNFLAFMNQGLKQYEHCKKVFSICGYSNKVKVPFGYNYDAYFCTRSSSWGWATWKDRWNSVDWQLEDWNKYDKLGKAFNRWGGSDCHKMLSDWKHGKNQSWAIRFCFNQFLQNKLSLFPIISKVNNNGFDGEGTNCKRWSRFKFIFDKEGAKTFLFPEDINIENRLYKSAMKYNSLSIRIYSRLMYFLH